MRTRLDLYQKVIPLAHLGIWEINLLTGGVYYNDFAKEIYEVEENSKPSFEESITFYVDQDAIRTLIKKMSITGTPQVDEFQLITAKGNYKWVKVRMNARYEDGITTNIYGTIEDVSLQVKLMTTLAEREEQFHHAFEYAPIGMALVSTKMAWIKVNKMLCQILGYNEEELLPKELRDLTHTEDRDIDLIEMHDLLKENIHSYKIIKRYVHKNNSTIWASLHVTLIRDQKRNPLYFLLQLKDITEQKKYTEMLLKEQLRLDNIIKSTQVGTWEWDFAADKIVCDQRIADILGYRPEELTLKPARLWEDLIHPDDQESNLREMEFCFQQKAKFYACECRMRLLNRKWKWVELRGKVIDWSSDKRPLIMLGTLADIEERKQMELERTKTFEIISAQNSRLLNFAHIVSHNLRSHTGNIQMLIDMIAQEKDVEEKENLFKMLSTNVNSLQTTLSHLNEVVNIQAHNKQSLKEVNLLQEINKILSILSELLRGSQAELDIKVNPVLMLVCNHSYLESILLNLITNAIKYRRPDCKLKIIITTQELENKIILTIEDNGLGIDLELHGHKLFGMYKTFHGNDDARGIGLFLVKNQIEAMGGSISVESVPGQGTVFKIGILKR